MHGPGPREPAAVAGNPPQTPRDVPGRDPNPNPAPDSRFARAPADTKTPTQPPSAMRHTLVRCFLCLSTLTWLAAALPRRLEPATAGGPLAELVAGNRRFVAGKSNHARQNGERRGELAREQHPFAVVVGCSDSRVPPEILFDQGLGDLFVVRVAGNVVDDVALASIEYAVEHLGAQTIVVLGHERCGAVRAVAEGADLTGHLVTLAAALRPAVEEAKLERPEDLVDAAVVANVRRVVRSLATSQPILEERVDAGLAIFGARYDLDSGEVEFLPREAVETHGGEAPHAR